MMNKTDQYIKQQRGHFLDRSYLFIKTRRFIAGFVIAHISMFLVGDGGGGGRYGGCHLGGNGNNEQAPNLRFLLASSQDDDDGEDEDEDTPIFTGFDFYVADIIAPSLPVEQGIPTLEDLTANLKTQVGFTSTRAELSEDLMTLTHTGMFENVEAEIRLVNHKSDKNHVQVIFKFTPREFPPMESFQVDGGSIVPQKIVDKVMVEYKNRGGGKIDMSTIALIKNIIEGYYQERGFVYSYISHFDGMEGGHVVANVTESRVKSVKVIPVDEAGNPTDKSELNLSMVEQDARNAIKEGEMFSIEDTRKALRDVFGTQMFDNVQVLHKPQDDRNQHNLINIEILVKERPARTVELELEWPMDPQPIVSNIAPGGSLLLEHRNVGGVGTHLSALITTQNFFRLLDDTSVKMELKRPYFFGMDDPKKTTLGVAMFNTRKLSSVFSTTGATEVPPIWVDRAGVKGTLTEHYTRNSKGSISAVAELISCRDESGALCNSGQRSGLDGDSQTGPLATLSDTGLDKTLLIQSSILRDATFFRQGIILGARDIFTADLGASMSAGLPIYNRHTASMTRFFALDQLTFGRLPNASFVIHGKFGNCIGDIASYDYFTLGGPSSNRGYNIGELGSGRRFIEVAAEMRYPIPKTRGQVFSFFEHANSLGSGASLSGKPNEFYRRKGKGSSWGYGVQLGAIRFEYDRDCNIGRGATFIRFGERF